MQNAHHGTAQAGTEFRDAEKDCCKARLSTTGTYCSLDAWMPGCLDAWMPGCLIAWLPRLRESGDIYCMKD